MRIKRKKIKKGILIFLYIITAIIVINISISKYETTSIVHKETTVAIMESNSYVEIENDIKMYPGCEPQIYDITITNKQNDAICDVTQSYKLKIERSEPQNLPLEIALYSDANCTQLLTPNEFGYYTDENYKFNARNRGK